MKLINFNAGQPGGSNTPGRMAKIDFGASNQDFLSGINATQKRVTFAAKIADAQARAAEFAKKQEEADRWVRLLEKPGQFLQAAGKAVVRPVLSIFQANQENFTGRQPGPLNIPGLGPIESYQSEANRIVREAKKNNDLGAAIKGTAGVAGEAGLDVISMFLPAGKGGVGLIRGGETVLSRGLGATKELLKVLPPIGAGYGLTESLKENQGLKDTAKNVATTALAATALAPVFGFGGAGLGALSRGISKGLSSLFEKGKSVTEVILGRKAEIAANPSEFLSKEGSKPKDIPTFLATRKDLNVVEVPSGVDPNGNQATATFSFNKETGQSTLYITPDATPETIAQAVGEYIARKNIQLKPLAEPPKKIANEVQPKGLTPQEEQAVAAINASNVVLKTPPKSELTAPSVISFVDDKGNKIITRLTNEELKVLTDEIRTIPSPKDGFAQIHLDADTPTLRDVSIEVPREQFIAGHPQAKEVFQIAQNGITKSAEEAAALLRPGLTKLQRAIEAEVQAVAGKGALPQDAIREILTNPSLAPKAPRLVKYIEDSGLDVPGVIGRSAKENVKISRVVKRANEELKTEDKIKGGEYTPGSLERWNAEATNLIESDPQRAMRIAFRLEKAPGDLPANVVAGQLAELAKANGNMKLYKELTLSRSLKLTREGQEIVTEKSFINGHNANFYMKQLINSRLNQVGGRLDALRALVGRVQGRKAKNPGTEKIEIEAGKMRKALESNKLDLTKAQALIDSLAC